MFSRVLPVLTVLKRSLVKTTKFDNPLYLGDPINAIRIFNEKKVNELILLDIGPAKMGLLPDFEHLKEMASECFIPLAYGGGISSLTQAEFAFNCGIEKLVLNSGALTNYDFIHRLACEFGSQSIVVSVDYKVNLFGKLRLFTHSGSNRVNSEFISVLKNIEASGAGEILLHNISRDGTFKGYDYGLVKSVSEVLCIPLIVCGGARDKMDCFNVLNYSSAAAASSCFVFHGNNKKSILINY